ncbi:putative 7-carboxy-7-deazaguanine synthase QueE [Petroclostridium sp. X23]|uniref:putative 7-carboxy-7-deazaguanine synthase QueE n=1 Tax=Petroclostridium sp. X23 TaxID=3045146 RepID=UPI0024AE1C3D|nr:putative 7-carboxy-7-deazaguanine synthase QueE [Petroclostridium sp. X23]WHH60233.1 putative 7-carboxy-7-deazaguanine synthase QueE [Petroclostridium sp. X23]
MKYKVVEKFISVNGEGQRVGQLAVFIRFAGCNLRCTYCDTMWANEENVSFQQMSQEEIYHYIKNTGVKNVTLTGGEPLLQEGIGELLRFLTDDGQLRVEIETNGSIELREFAEISPKRPVFTMDYKLGVSGMEKAMKTSNFQYLECQDTVKFVAGSMKDLETAKMIIEKYRLTERCAVHLSPVFGNITMETMVEFMKQNTMNDVRLQPQLHKVIWHPNARGV